MGDVFFEVFDANGVPTGEEQPLYVSGTAIYSTYMMRVHSVYFVSERTLVVDPNGSNAESGCEKYDSIYDPSWTSGNFSNGEITGGDMALKAYVSSTNDYNYFKNNPNNYSNYPDIFIDTENPCDYVPPPNDIVATFSRSAENYHLGSSWSGNDFPRRVCLSTGWVANNGDRGGTASGHGPLEELHNGLKELYEARIGETITSVDIVDTENLIGRCVVAGNVRRSAALALGQHDDREYLTMKNDQEKLYSHRWGSNNSFEAKVGMDYTWHAEQSQKNGEPGYIWLENARTRGRFKDGIRLDDHKVMGFNPCVEQQLEDGELCCLVETYPAKHDTYEDYLKTLKIAYLYGKTVTLANTHWPETNALMLKNRRIGLSQTGVVQAFNKFGRRTMYQWCDNAYEHVKELDEEYSDWLCIPRSVRMTSIKPSGTVSLLNGSTPGIHFPEDEYYIRRIRFAKDSTLIGPLTDAGYKIEEDSYSPNTLCVEFPVKEPHFRKGKRDVSMWEQLEIAAQYQHYWADNSVSITVTFQPHEANQIKSALEMYETRLKAVSFLRYEETGYVQAPYEPITKEQYEDMVKNITPIQRIDTDEGGVGTKFCTNDTCEI